MRLLLCNCIVFPVIIDLTSIGSRGFVTRMSLWLDATIDTGSASKTMGAVTPDGASGVYANDYG
jgi:hypothetical protein